MAKATTVDLTALKQREAAWLLDMGTRAVRDLHIARNPDGSYDGREVVRYAVQRSAGTPKLTDDHDELLARLRESFVPDDGCVGLLRTFDAMDGEFGDPGVIVVARELMDLIRDSVASAPSAEVIEHQQQAAARHRQFTEATDRLEYRVVCSSCDKVRTGTKWRTERLASNVTTLAETCPKCEKAAK